MSDPLFPDWQCQKSGDSTFGCVKIMTSGACDGGDDPSISCTQESCQSKCGTDTQIINACLNAISNSPKCVIDLDCENLPVQCDNVVNLAPYCSNYKCATRPISGHPISVKSFQRSYVDVSSSPSPSPSPQPSPQPSPILVVTPSQPPQPQPSPILVVTPSQPPQPSSPSSSSGGLSLTMIIMIVLIVVALIVTGGIVYFKMYRYNLKI